MLWNDIMTVLRKIFHFLKYGGWKKVIVSIVILLAFANLSLISFYTRFAFEERSPQERSQYFGCDYNKKKRQQTLCIAWDLQLEVFRRLHTLITSPFETK